MDPRPLVELCGGSAALSLAADGLKPPIYYRGGKRRFVREILNHLPLVRPYLVRPRTVVGVLVGHERRRDCDGDPVQRP